MCLVCAYNILETLKCVYGSKNCELKITFLLVHIIVNTECQQRHAAGLYQTLSTSG